MGDNAFHHALLNSFYYTVGTIFPSAALALVIALLLDQKIRGLAFFRTAYYIPQIASWVAISMIWIYMFNPSFGVINYVLSFFGIPKLGWLNDTKLALPSIIIVGIWRNLGYNVVIYLAGLQGIPGYLYEAAVIDGANRWRQFWRITWPLLLPTTMFILIITGIFALQAFDQIFVLTQGGPADASVTVVFSIYRNAFQYLKMGYASAMAFVLFVIIFILSALSLRLSGQLGEQ
jgi:ABC-type sugar transport system permease subunit